MATMVVSTAQYEKNKRQWKQSINTTSLAPMKCPSGIRGLVGGRVWWILES